MEPNGKIKEFISQTVESNEDINILEFLKKVNRRFYGTS